MYNFINGRLIPFIILAFIAYIAIASFIGLKDAAVTAGSNALTEKTNSITSGFSGFNH